MNEEYITVHSSASRSLIQGAGRTDPRVAVRMRVTPYIRECARA